MRRGTLVTAGARRYSHCRVCERRDAAPHSRESTVPAKLWEWGVLLSHVTYNHIKPVFRVPFTSTEDTVRTLDGSVGDTGIEPVTSTVSR